MPGYLLKVHPTTTNHLVAQNSGFLIHKRPGPLMDHSQNNHIQCAHQCNHPLPNSTYLLPEIRLGLAIPRYHGICHIWHGKCFSRYQAKGNTPLNCTETVLVPTTSGVTKTALIGAASRFFLNRARPHAQGLALFLSIRIGYTVLVTADDVIDSRDSGWFGLLIRWRVIGNG